jgi:hypothetical protein
MKLKLIYKREISKRTKLKPLYSRGIGRIFKKNDNDHDHDQTGIEHTFEDEEELSTYDLAKKQFKDAGLSTYLTSSIGGGKNQLQINSIIKRTVDCILWCTGKIKDGETDLKENSILSLLKDLIFNHYRLILDYATFLEISKVKAPSTVCNYFYEIASVSKWLKYFSSSDSRCVDLTGFNMVISSIKKSYKRKMKITRTDHDLAQCIQNRRLPINGLRDLMKCIDQELCWAHSYFNSNNWQNTFDKDIFNRVMEILYASLYVFSAQGRKGGIEELKYQQGKIMLERGHANSTVFKTRATFGYQPCTLSKKSYPLFKIYFLNIRPLVACENISNGNDPLWLTWT